MVMQSTFLRTVLSVKCLQDKYVRVFYGHLIFSLSLCLLILLRFWLYKKRTLSLLFLPNISCPSPTQNIYFEKEKTFEFCWDRTQYSYVPTNSDLKYSTLTTRPIWYVKNSTFSLAVQGSGCGLRKISFFLLGGFPVYFEVGIGKGANMGAPFMKRHTTTQFCSLLPHSLGVRTMMSTKCGQ